MTDPFDDPDARRERSHNPAGSAFGPAADPPTQPDPRLPFTPPSSQPQFGPSATGFASWLAHQPDMSPSFFEHTMNTFEGILLVMRDAVLRPDVPQHMTKLIELMIDDEAAGGADPDLADEVLEVLDVYLHFRIDNSRDPEEWEDVHDVLEEAMEARDDATELDGPLGDLLSEPDPVPDDVKLRAYARLPILRAVPELLAWMGKGCAVTATGALRRADIEHVAGLMGIRAYGTNEPWSPRSDPDAPIAARSMSDVPLLDAWWEALQTAHVIERDRSRMRPGGAATSMASALTLDNAEELIAYFFANVVTGSGWLAPVAEEAATEVIARILEILDPGALARSPEPYEWRSMRDEVVEGLADSRMNDLASMGLLAATKEGGWNIPDELRHVVARATVLAATLAIADED